MNTNMEKKEFQIMNGPSADRLIDAFKYAYDETVKLPVLFVVALRLIDARSFVQMKVERFRITYIQHEDGSNHSFNVAGYCYASSLEPVPGRDLPLVSYRFEAYYNSATRKGSIRFHS